MTIAETPPVKAQRWKKGWQVAENGAAGPKRQVAMFYGRNADDRARRYAEFLNAERAAQALDAEHREICR